MGGAALPEGRGVWSRRVALALKSRIGVGSAAFRSAQDQEVDVDTVFAGVWRRSVLEAHGGWDEGWPMNQDGELAGRIRGNGGRIVCLPEMAARYIPRDSLRALARQYARYGFYKGKTVRRHPVTLRRSLLLPPALVATLVVAALPGPAGRLARRGGAPNCTGTALGVEALRLRSQAADVVTLPAVWATMHVAWGCGFLTAWARFGPPLQAIRESFGRGRRQRARRTP